MICNVNFFYIIGKFIYGNIRFGIIRIVKKENQLFFNEIDFKLGIYIYKICDFISGC